MSAEKVIEIAKGEVGYLEKKSNYQLDDKTSNAGSNNYTKYGAWYGMNAQPWCDMFVSWCAAQAGEADAVGKFAYVPAHQNFFANKGQYYARGKITPKAGDIVIFRDESHIGFVEYVSGGYVHTIEGNTSGGSGLVTNGGGVFRKSYPLSSSYIQGYCVPAYSGSSTEDNNQNNDQEEFEVAKTYQNGSTPEIVYADTNKKIKIGSLNEWESCDCLGTVDSMYIVKYPVDGTDYYKVGVVEYDGGLG